ncbi:hypothetical protein BTA51_28370 [Hahella sp. CCB-MM4]|uniref:HAD family hydrolase n=1 Tax=Hahella sp. (strain CCB-MM4) TaxID=1926491 RepID=UPI000B9C60B1|nr:HAD family phosphatase [Hahella sp. CCB-MM4]OZG69988.1 hypothetical protein BTA51_28370 [Hahella sp. CCB-MM4]
MPPRKGNAIFDMDGLLINSEPVWQSVEQAVLKAQYGLHLSSAELARYAGTSTSYVSLALARDYPDHSIDHIHLAFCILEEMHRRIEEVPLMPGARELLEVMREGDIPVAIASSSPMSLIDAVIQTHQLPVYITASATEVPYPKPHPAVFLLAAQRLGAEAWDCIVWEDSLNGVIAAKSAGMGVVAVPEADHPTPEKFAIADLIHTSLNESLNTETYFSMFGMAWMPA